MKTIPQLAKEYGISEPTLSKYKASGTDIHDEQAVKTRFTKNKGATKAYRKKVKKRMKPVKLPLPKTETRGLNAALERLRDLEPLLNMVYHKSRFDGDPLDEQAAKMKQWLDVAEKLRITETTNPDVSEKTKNLVSATDTVNAWISALKTFAIEMENLGARVATQFGNQEVKLFIDDEAKRILRTLEQCQWLENGDNVSDRPTT